MLDFSTCEGLWARKNHMFHGVRVYYAYHIQKVDGTLYALNEVSRTWDNDTRSWASKEKWQVKRVAEIAPTRITIASRLTPGAESQLFHLYVNRSNTIKHNGLHFNYYRDGPLVVGTYPITIQDGELFASPSKQRTWDKAKQKELNDEIKRVRRAIKLRTKFGVFHELTPEEQDRTRKMAPNGRIWTFQNDALNILKRVNEEDYDSFLPLIYVARHGSDQNIWDNSKMSYRRKTIEESIETVLNSWRRRAQKDNEIVRYE